MLLSYIAIRVANDEQNNSFINENEGATELLKTLVHSGQIRSMVSCYQPTTSKRNTKIDFGI